MLCCVLLLALFALPALVVGRLARRHRVSPLAWRLGCSNEVLLQSASFAPQFRLLVRNRIRSFAFAGAGIQHVIRNEPAFLIHGAATAIVFGSGVLLDITAKDWRWIVVAVMLVWSAEAFNTAIESTCNLLSPDFSEHVRIAKDVGAGAVLLVSIGAVTIGLLTFWPYLGAILPTMAGLSGLVLPLCTAL